MFSIVIPVYNKEKWIIKCLDSVLNQTFPSFEILIIDDGSTDNSLALIEKKYNDCRIKIITQKNQGVSAARNTGIALAKSEWIAFLDADDIWDHTFLQSISTAIKQYPTSYIIGTNYEKVRESNNLPIHDIDEIKLNYRQINHYFEHAATSHLFSASSTVVRRSAFDTVLPFNTSLTNGEDLDVWFRLMLHFDGLYIDNKLAYYVQVHNSINNNDPFKLAPIEKSFVYSMLERYQQYMYPKEKKPGFRNFVYTMLLKYLSLYYFDTRYRKEAATILKKIPLRYKIRRLKNLIYVLPYPIGYYLYQKIMVAKHKVV